LETPFEGHCFFHRARPRLGLLRLFIAQFARSGQNHVLSSSTVESKAVFFPGFCLFLVLLLSQGRRFSLNTFPHWSLGLFDRDLPPSSTFLTFSFLTSPAVFFFSPGPFAFTRYYFPPPLGPGLFGLSLCFFFFLYQVDSSANPSLPQFLPPLSFPTLLFFRAFS